VASFFGLADGVLEGGFVTRHAVEPTLSPKRVRALVLIAAAMSLTWNLQSVSSQEREPADLLLSAPLSSASTYVDQLQSTAPMPGAPFDSIQAAAHLLNPASSDQEQTEPPLISTVTPPELMVSPAETIAPTSSPLPTTTPLPATELPAPTDEPKLPIVPSSSPTADSASASEGVNQATPSETPPSLSLSPSSGEDPAVTPTPTAAPPSETPVRGWDAYENNYDFDHAAAIAPGTPLRQLNFACPDHGDCADNDFFQVELTGGNCYRVATSDLSPGIDTNVIVYGPERDRRPPLGGNDNAAPGELRSQLDVCVRGRGPMTGFIAVGNYRNQRPPDPIAARTYTLEVTRLEGTPTSVGDAGQPHRCPLLPDRGAPIVVQGWGVGTHAPAAQWGGVDLIVRGGPTMGTPIVATHAGRVQVYLNSWPGGNYVSISSDAGWRTAYAHLNTVLVRHGAYVEAGTIIGTVGQTGWATGPHLHYETWHHGVNVNPAPFLFCD
jgi:hypothetical protein